MGASPHSFCVWIGIQQMKTLFAFLLLLGTSSACAQQVLLLGGFSQEHNLSETTYTWSMEYAQDLDSNTYATFSWFNEGHLEDHHRDGPVVQIWHGFDFPGRHMKLAVGIGPYIYFDTAQAEAGASYSNDHGLGLIYSTGLSWPITRRWLLHLRANRIESDGPVDTTSIAFGGGYLLGPPTKGLNTDASARPAKTTDNEVTALFGATILNSFGSELSAAKSIEYRRRWGQFTEWTLSLLHEDANRLIRRNGVTGQIWLSGNFLNDRISLGTGIGAYFVINKEHRADNDDTGDERVSAILTTTASYRFDSHWLSRLSWNRVMTNYSRDTDVILMGLGYRF